MRKLSVEKKRENGVRNWIRKWNKKVDSPLKEVSGVQSWIKKMGHEI